MFAFSNFEPCEVELDGEVYPTVEHAYQAAKSLRPEDRAKIRRARTPGMAKKLGRVFGLRRDWEEIKFDVMRGLLEQKFVQEPWRSRLLEHQGEIVEWNYWHDKIWGMCVCTDCRGKGANHLGRLMTEIRETILAVG
jgi:ribA/ribD-fused uncharacterized protein